MDTKDPLAPFRDEFVFDDPSLIYLDGNSLGRLPKRTAALMRGLVEEQWGGRLVRGWGEHWIDLPQRLGAKIASLIGAQPDEVLVCDSTSVNFYKLAMAALGLRPDRVSIVTDNANFPSDLYLMQGCAKQLDRELLVVEPHEVPEALNNRTALLSLSHTSFKTGLIHPMADLTRAAHDSGALTLWDLSHSVGAVPLDLNGSNADLAVGCTYKYLNGGPGAPAFLYVRRDLHEGMENPIWGWFGQKNAFDFSLRYEPANAIQRFMAGTPPILSMAAVECGVDLILEASMPALREKSTRQTEFLIQLWEENLAPLGVTLNSPRDAKVRGSHVSLGHPNAFAIDQALIHDMNVVPDFRAPDNIRLGVTPISTTFEELVLAIQRIKMVIDERIYEKYSSGPTGVT
jgi:kynureninase